VVNERAAVIGNKFVSHSRCVPGLSDRRLSPENKLGGVSDALPGLAGRRRSSENKPGDKSGAPRTCSGSRQSSDSKFAAFPVIFFALFCSLCHRD
jgi:hypothetical protein